MIGLIIVKKNYDNMLSRFHLILERHGRNDGQSELLYQYRACVLTRGKTRGIEEDAPGPTLLDMVKAKTKWLQNTVSTAIVSSGDGTEDPRFICLPRDAMHSAE